MIIRKATIDDIDLLIKLRIDYIIADKGALSQNDEMAIKEQLAKYFVKHIADHSFIGMLAEIENNVASVACLVISEKPANPSFITGITGTLVNVLTYPEYRRRGIATEVIKKLIEEAMLLGVSAIELSATSTGKPLYEKLGFSISKYTSMSLKLI